MKFSNLSRIHINSIITKNQTLTLTGDIFHYCRSVLRMKIADEFRLFNQLDGEFRVMITAMNKHNLQVVVLDKLRDVLAAYPLILCMCLIKPDRFTQSVKAAVALGITEIMPIVSARTQTKTINRARLEQCIIEAVEQSERFQIPILHDPLRLEQLLLQPVKRIIFANEEETHDINLYNSVTEFKEKLAILIGPEGGFSAEERTKLISDPRVVSISLGDGVLRSELAATVCIAQTIIVRNSRIGNNKITH